MGAFSVIYDACVLHPMALCDFLLRLAEAGVVQARWTDMILDEVIRSIRDRRPELPEARLVRRRENMRDAAPDCIVAGFESLIEGLDLPDPNDRHVLAAAIRSGAQGIVTLNLSDFPRRALAQYAIEALHPDDFVYDLLDISEGAALSVIHEQAAALKKSPMTVHEVLDALERNGLVRSTSRLRGCL